MATTRSIRAGDVREILRLVNELHALPAANLAARKRHLLENLCRILGAKVGAVVSLADGHGPHWQFRSPVVVDYGWPSERERSALVAYRDEVVGEREVDGDPMEAMLKVPGQVVTRRRTDLHDDVAWYRRTFVNERRRPARVDDCLYTLFRLPGASMMVGLGLHRDWGDRRRFGRREADILQILNEHLEFLWRGDAPDETLHLAPRLRQTLVLLLRGHSEKETAARLNLSRNTVHKYVTALYRHLGVTTRAELMARHIVGGRAGFPDVTSDDAACNARRVN